MNLGPLISPINFHSNNLAAFPFSVFFVATLRTPIVVLYDLPQPGAEHGKSQNRSFPSSLMMAPHVEAHSSATTRPGTALPSVVVTAASQKSSSTSALAPSPPPQSPKPSKTSKTSKTLNLDAGQERMFRCYAGFCACTINYLRPEDEALAEISIVELDLQSGYVSDGGPRFIEPVLSVEMDAFVAREEPWKRYGLDPEEGEERPENREGQHWAEDYMFHEGAFMFNALDTFASARAHAYFNPSWRAVCGCNPTIFNLQFCSPRDLRRWLVHATMETREGGKPHIQVLMHGTIPLQEDTLTVGEMAVATGMVAIRRYFEKFNHHRYIPITIFSAACRQLRIVQVWHDKQKPLAINVRRSRIVDFTEGWEANRKDWIDVLCWLMGKPIGEMVEGHAGEAESQEKETASSQQDIKQAASNHSDSSDSGASHLDSNHSDSDDSDNSICDHAEETPCTNQDKTPDETLSPPSTP